MIVTIDGPCASGKSTVAQVLASKLSCIYLCSGLLYRAVAYILLDTVHYTEHMLANPDKTDIDLIASGDLLKYEYTGTKGVAIFFNGRDITPQLYAPEVERGASIVSTDLYVRNVLDAMQHKIADCQNVVVEGRDAGSVVFSEAEYKFFLTAPIEVRAMRWLSRQKGRDITLQEAIARIAERDDRDAQRAVAPLAIPQDAIIVDSSGKTVDQVVEQLRKYILSNKKGV